MAKPLKYEVPEPEWTVLKTADDELRELIELLHQRGVLRLANELLGALPQVSAAFMEGVNNQSGSNAIQNLSSLVQLIGDLPPEEFRRICKGMTEGMQAALNETEVSGKRKAPGITGAMKLLKDDQLWTEMAPLVRAAQTFTKAIHQNTDFAAHGSQHSG